MAGGLRFSQQLTDGKLEAVLAVKHGTLKLSSVKLALPKPGLAVGKVVVTSAGKPLAARHEIRDGVVVITLAEPVVLTTANELRLTLAP